MFRYITDLTKMKNKIEILFNCLFGGYIIFFIIIILHKILLGLSQLNLDVLGRKVIITIVQNLLY